MLTRGGKEQSAYCVFSPSKGHHFKMSRCGCEFLSPRPPPLFFPLPPSCSVCRQILWFPVSQWTCKRKNFIWERERRKSTSFSFFFLLDLYNHFKMDTVLLCFIHGRWFESYVGPKWERDDFGFFSLCLVTNQRLHSLFSVHVDYRQQCFHCYSIFSTWQRSCCDHSAFLVFKKKQVTTKLPTTSVLPECMFVVRMCVNVYISFFKFFKLDMKFQT